MGEDDAEGGDAVETRRAVRGEEEGRERGRGRERRE